MTYYAPKESLPYGKKFSSKKFKVLRYNPGVTDGFNLGTSVPTNCCCREHMACKGPYFTKTAFIHIFYMS